MSIIFDTPSTTKTGKSALRENKTPKTYYAQRTYAQRTGMGSLFIEYGCDIMNILPSKILGLDKFVCTPEWSQ